MVLEAWFAPDLPVASSKSTPGVGICILVGIGIGIFVVIGIRIFVLEAVLEARFALNLLVAYSKPPQVLVFVSVLLFVSIFVFVFV